MTCIHCLTSQPPPFACQTDPTYLALVVCAVNACGATCTSVSSSSASSSSSSSGTTCLQGCGLKDPPGEQRFTTYELKECGCAGGPCAMVCSGACANPSTFTPGSPCGQCLLAQEALKMGSTCTVKAALNDCQPDPVCVPFLACALSCP
jgi:hypothetical protein